MQQEQATAISQLDQNVTGLTAALAGLSARFSSVDAQEADTTRRIGEVDAEIRVLRAGVSEVRQAQSAAEDAWREPIADLKAAASRTHGDIGRLRASIDELSRARQPDLGAIAAKVDRIEHAMMERNLLGGMRGSIREHADGKQPAAADLASAADGHIITLPPAQ
jgi:chromosome segregation ATPase